MFKSAEHPADERIMTELLDMPAVPLAGTLDKVKPSKRQLAKWVATPVAGVALLCVIDVQTTGQQRAAECTSTQQAVSVPKPHIWLAGAITGLADTQTALRDVMAASHPDVALTAIVAANPTISLSPMGNVPPTYGGRACLSLPAASSVTAPRAVKSAPKDSVLVLPGH